MKKTNIRVHRNGGSKTAASQVPNQPEAANGKAQPQPYEGKVNLDTWDPQGAALVLMSGSKSGPEEEIAGLNYSEAEFAEIQRTATNSKQTLAAFLHSAIEARLNSFAAMGELDDAIIQTEALYALMEHQVFYPLDGVEHTERTKSGLADLASMTFDRLRQAHESASKLAPLKGGTAKEIDEGPANPQAEATYQSVDELCAKIGRFPEWAKKIAYVEIDKLYKCSCRKRGVHPTLATVKSGAR